MKNKLVTTLLLTVATAFILAGCGESDNQDDCHPFYGETLTIAVPHTFHMGPFSEAYMAQNPGVTIELISFDFDGDWQGVREVIGLQLLTGTAPTLIHSIALDHNDPNVTRFLIDWFPFMGADPYFIEENYFMSVFHAAARNNRLYAFPFNFSFRAIAANSTVPGLVDALEGLESVTLLQLMELHRQSPTENPLFMYADFDALTGLSSTLYYFFDLGTQRIDFYNQTFKDFITYAREITNPHSGTDFGWTRSYNALDQETQAVWDQTYMFIRFDASHGFHNFMDFEDFTFKGATPVTNNQGELIIYPFGGYVLNGQSTPAQQALAWDFIHFILRAHETLPGLYINLLPVNKDLLRAGLERQIPPRISQMARYGWQVYNPNNEPITHIINEAVEYVHSRIVAVNDIPMVASDVHTPVWDILLETMENFQIGLLSAEQTAQDLQNRIRLVMMEME